MRIDQAKKIAVAYNENVNTCYEYKEGYFFCEKELDSIGGDNGFVVLKVTGKIVTMSTFIEKYSSESKGTKIKM